MSTQEVANKLVQYCRQGKNVDAINELYADNIVSLEPKESMAPRTEGKANCLAKTQQWLSMVEQFHGSTISDPIVTAAFFACIMETDVTMKGMGRTQLKEVCVYEVDNGKVIFEQYFYKMGK